MKIILTEEQASKLLSTYKKVSKGSIKLKEDVDANIGSANGIQQAQMKARQLMSKNSTVSSASADAGHLAGQSDANSGEGMKLELPVNANGKQLAQAQRMTQNQSNDDMQITFTKPQVNGEIEDTNESVRAKKIMEMRNNAIPFTKKELGEFLNSL